MSTLYCATNQKENNSRIYLDFFFNTPWKVYPKSTKKDDIHVTADNHLYFRSKEQDTSHRWVMGYVYCRIDPRVIVKRDYRECYIAGQFGSEINISVGY